MQLGHNLVEIAEKVEVDHIPSPPNTLVHSDAKLVEQHYSSLGNYRTAASCTNQICRKLQKFDCAAF